MPNWCMTSYALIGERKTRSLASGRKYAACMIR